MLLTRFCLFTYRYINNAYGDESLETLYGQNLQRLQGIKKTVDPHKRFNFWFPLS